MRLENTFLFVDGVGPRTERKLWRAGMTHWNDFDPESVHGLGPVTSQRITTTLDRARVALDRDDPHYFAERLPANETWRMYENFREETCFLDIETTGLSIGRDRTTTVSLHRNGTTDTLVRGRDLSRERLMAELQDVPLVVTFNGARFDLPFLRDEFNLDLPIPHLDLMGVCRRVGLTGGLKRIERTLGLERPVDDVDGREAVRLWYRYRDGDADALGRLVAYNRLDAENLRPVAKRVTTLLEQDVFVTE